MGKRLEKSVKFKEIKESLEKNIKILLLRLDFNFVLSES